MVERAVDCSNQNNEARLEILKLRLDRILLPSLFRYQRLETKVRAV